MVLDSDLKQELNLIALSENMTTGEVIHSVLADFNENYWIEMKQKPKANVGFQGENK